MPTFHEKVVQVIPAEFYLISSSDDTQQSNEAYNTSDFELPNPNGKSGGACTSTLLQVLYEHGHETLTWMQLLQLLKAKLDEYHQTPVLTTSRWLDVHHHPVRICPPKSGRRRALVIGINYVGQTGELKACHNDARNVYSYLKEAQGFAESEMLLLIDDGKHAEPTKRNIQDGFVRLTQYSQPGDVVFVSFSGHGGQTVDLDGDEDDGMDETIIPLDFRKHGQIVDDEILDTFVKPMKKGVTVTVLMDCCHSGTVMDLPYVFSSADGTMKMEKNFKFGPSKQKQREEQQEQMEKQQNGSDRSLEYGEQAPPLPVPKPRAPDPHRPAPPPPPPTCGCSVM